MSRPTQRKRPTNNPIARVLSDGRYRPRVVKDKTKYDSKRDGKIWKRNVRKEPEDTN